MLTPQEVSSRSFSKAMMGGYNMAMVDEFLDELTDDYTALYKENAALKAKMKVLVEKIEDYRATEDSMRATLLTAQKMADSIVREAEQKRDAMLTEANAKHASMISDAETAAFVKIGQLQQKIAETEARYQQGQEELARFIAACEDVCNRQLALLGELPALSVKVPTPVVELPVAEEVPAPTVTEEIVDSVAAAFGMEEEAPVEEIPAPAEEPVQSPVVTDVDFGATRRINLGDLQFGRNYNGEN